MANVMGALVMTESGKYQYDFSVEQISRSGEVNPAALDLLAEQQTLADLTKRLKEDIDKTTKEKILNGQYEGDQMDVNYRLHKDLAKLRCDCSTEADRVFVKATVSEVSSGLLKKKYKVAATYACPNCKDTFSGECIFSVSKLKLSKK